MKNYWLEKRKNTCASYECSGYVIVRYRNKNNQLHREDGPAVIWSNGDKYWYLDGHIHHKECADGSKIWFDEYGVRKRT